MTYDEWRLLRYGLLTAGLMGLVLVPILIHNRNFPKVQQKQFWALLR